jgi:hypothetical protein
MFYYCQKYILLLLKFQKVCTHVVQIYKLYLSNFMINKEN